MKVKWLGHAPFLITAKDGTRIITDPYRPNPPSLAYKKINESAEVVTVSHEHGDHNDVGSVGGQPQVIRGVGAHKAKNIEFEGFATYHDTAQGGQRGANTIFCFAVDGIRLCHVGDLGHTLSPQTVKDIGEVDILLLNTGGGPTIGVQEANEVLSAIKPKVVIPMHVKNDKCTFNRYTADDFVSGKTGVKRADATEEEFTKEKLPKATEIVVLNPAM